MSIKYVDDLKEEKSEKHNRVMQIETEIMSDWSHVLKLYEDYIDIQSRLNDLNIRYNIYNNDQNFQKFINLKYTDDEKKDFSTRLKNVSKALSEINKI